MARGARRATLAALGAALCALAACGRKADLPPVGALRVRATDLAPALAEAGIDAAVTAQTAQEGLRGAGLRIDEGARRGYVATIEVTAFSVIPGIAGGPPEAEVVVDVELAPSWAAGPTARRTGTARSSLGKGRPQAAWRDALRSSTRDAAAAVALDLRALRKAPEALEADLEAGDPRVRERAIRALTAQGARGRLRAIERRIRDPDAAVARAAIDAVVAFREPRSALVLIEAAQAGDVGVTLRLIPVLVDLGGADVEGYLLTLASGHSDRAVRRAASEALARVRAPAGAPATRGARR